MRFGIAAIAALALLASAPAQANLIALTYNDQYGCSYNCSFVSNGAKLRLTLYIDSSDLVPGANLNTPDFQGFKLDVGSIHLALGLGIAYGDQDISSYNFHGILPATGNWSGPFDSAHDWNFTLTTSNKQISIGSLGWLISNNAGTHYEGELPGADVNTLSKSSASINLNTPVPSSATSTTLTVGDFLTPSSVLGQLQSWMSEFEDQLPPEAQDELYKISTNPDLKVGAKLGTAALGKTLTAISLADASKLLTNPGDATTKALVMLGISDAQGFAQYVLGSGGSSDVQADIELANLGLDAALATAGCDNPTACLVEADKFIWGDLVLPQLKQLGDDPPDPDYQSVFVLPDSMISPIFSTSDDTFNEAAASAYSDLEAAGAYLYAANVSLNRYSSALAAGDAVSALNQLQAFAHYVSLYKDAMGTASNDFSSLYSLPEVQDIYDGGIDLSALEAFQQELAANGLSPDDLQAFYDLGLTDDQINDIVGDVETYVPTLPPDTADQIYTQSRNGFALALGNLDSVDAPEPLTASLFLAGLAGIGLGRRRKLV